MPARKRDTRSRPTRRDLAAMLGGALAVGFGAGEAAADPELQVAGQRTVPLAASTPGVAIEQRRFSLRGLAVRGAFETAKVAPDGVRRVVAARTPVADPQVDPDDAVVDADALPELVQRALGLPAPPRFEGPAQLVYILVLGQPVLAWEAQLPLSLTPAPSRKTVWVSAMTGRVLDEREQVLSARARVFPENPAKTPDAVEVPLTTLADAAPGDPLASDKIIALNCVTQEPDEVPDYVKEDECFPVHRTFADDNGDYFVPLPDILDVRDSVQPEDRYTELSMYHHTERFLDALALRGLGRFSCEPATLLANVRDLPPEGDLDFTPLNNAFYTNQCNPELGATMLFGQGSEVDFGYDADVIYHELGHGVVALLAPEGLNGRYARSDSSGVDAGAMNEALADYFSFMITEDPRLAEYVGRFWSSSGGQQIRNAENSNRCPDNSIGQVHNDGEAFAAALWATRSKLDGDTIPSRRIVLDKIVLATLTRLPPDATFTDGTAALLAEAEEFRDVGEFDDFSFGVLERALRVRGLGSCARIITDPDDVESGRGMHLRKYSNAVHPFWPGPMQLRYEVPPGVDGVEIRMSLRNRGSDGVGANVLVKFGHEPIGFEYELTALDDPGDATGESGRIREVTLVSGDWDLELTPEEFESSEFRAPLSNLSPGEVFHATVVSLSANDLTAGGVRVVPNVFVPGDEDSGDDGGDATSSGGAGAGEDAVHGEAAVAGGCGCRHGSPAWAVLVLPFALRRSRRR